tara:strand:- start:261 stop:1163 length:903 start_codon:yes stop_codon:yes gene_type:complete
MKKAEAIQLLRSKFSLNNSNCHFSKINKAVPLWWFNIRPEKFKNDLYLILKEETELLLLKIPGGSFSTPKNHFHIRRDKNAVDLRISSVKDENYLKDILSGGTFVNFEKYLIHKEPIPKEYKNPEIRNINSFSRPVNGSTDVKLKSHQVIIKNNTTGFSYQSLFSNYLKGATYITLQDPYLRLQHQFENLFDFCLMLEKNKTSDSTINLKVITWNDDEYQTLSKSKLEELKSGIKPYGINLEYRLEKHHDRFIHANNGWKISLGRGLDIFEKPESQYSIAVKDQTKRKCRSCEITYLNLD